MLKMTKSIDERLEEDLSFLLYDATGNFEPSSSNARFASSPIKCLDKAIDKPPQVVVVRFGKISIREREALVELCSALKRNSRTRGCLVLALLSAKHRKLVEDLKQINVDYIRFVDDGNMNFEQIRKIIQGIRPSDRLEQHLEVLCPFLHYDQIDCWRELITCGAYLDRRVLGGRWLQEICETDTHLQCEYYLNPRLKS